MVAKSCGHGCRLESKGCWSCAPRLPRPRLAGRLRAPVCQQRLCLQVCCSLRLQQPPLRFRQPIRRCQLQLELPVLLQRLQCCCHLGLHRCAAGSRLRRRPRTVAQRQLLSGGCCRFLCMAGVEHRRDSTGRVLHAKHLRPQQQCRQPPYKPGGTSLDPICLTGGAAGPSSRRSAACTAVHCTSSVPQSTSCCVRRASSSALSSSAPQSAAGRPAPAGRAVTEPASGAAAAAEGAAGWADRSGAAALAAALPVSLPSDSAGTRLEGGCASAAVPGRLLGLAGKPGLAATAGAVPAVAARALECCCARGSLRGDHLPPPPPLPFKLLLLPSACSGGCCCSCCCCWEGCPGPCRPTAAGVTSGSAAAAVGAAPGAALLMLRRPSLPPLTLPVLPLLGAECCPGWDPA